MLCCFLHSGKLRSSARTDASAASRCASAISVAVEGRRSVPQLHGFGGVDKHYSSPSSLAPSVLRTRTLLDVLTSTVMSSFSPSV